MKGENSFALECHHRVRARQWAHRALNATLITRRSYTQDSRLGNGWASVCQQGDEVRTQAASARCPWNAGGCRAAVFVFFSVRYVFEAHEYARHPLWPRGVWKLSLACGKECTPFVCTHIHQIFHANLAHWKLCINIVYTGSR